MSRWIRRSGKNLELMKISEAGLNRRLEHRAFAEVVERRKLQHVEVGFVGAVKVERIGERLAIVLRNVKQSVTSAALLVKVVESGIGHAGCSVQTWRS